MIGETHRALRERLGAHVLGQLTEAESTEVRTHLAGCADCQAELGGIDPVAARLAGLDPARLTEPMPEPAPSVLEGIVREIRAEGRSLLRPIRPSLLTSMAAGILVACMLAGGGYLLGAQNASSTAVVAESVPVTIADPAVRGGAALVAHTWGMEVKLTATGFTQGQTYRVSVTDRDGRQVSAGEFIGTGPRQMLCNLNSSVLRPDATSFQVYDPEGAVVLTAGTG